MSMRIYYSMPDELMLLDSLEGMNALHAQMRNFLASESQSIRLDAEQWGSAEPHDELLPGLEIIKGDGPLLLTMTPEKWLTLRGSRTNLERYVSHFHFDKDDENHCPDRPPAGDYISPVSMSMMVEVCSDWIRELRAKRH